jgi:BirA family transcriptional regulator, biotin operon repressor / biotin---[acetyl-CoA-carboxylase] ligase
VSEARARVDALITGPSVWSRLEHLDTVGSTNDEVVARVRGGAPAGLVVVADSQTAGRGRLGRPWMDVPGASLLLSVATGVPARGAGLVPLATGLAVGDALRRLGLAPRLKWPNDVLLVVGEPPTARKCAGILVESHDLRPDGPAFLVIGIGIDVDWREVARDETSSAWTSLAEAAGAPIDRWELLHDVLRALEAWLLDVPQDPTRLLAAYKVRCTTIGARVRVTTPRDVIEGLAVDLDERGALIVDSRTGRHAIVAGDVEHLTAG